jgi:hypothetical protein
MDDAGNPPKKRWAFLSEDALRHPLASMLIGFVLTGVVGTLLTNHFAELRQQEARAIEQRDARRKAVLEVSRLFTERLGRAEALAVAIEAHAAREVVARLKQQYDDADMRALVVRQEAILLMREAMLETDFESLRAEIDGRLVTKRMQPLRECLDRAGARALANADGAAVLRECRATQLLTESRACGDVVSDALYDLASLPAAKAADPDAHAERIRAKNRDRIAQACP